MPDIRCGKCGNVAQPKDLYCRKCGSSLGAKTVVAVSTQSEKPKQNHNSQTAPPVTPEQRQQQQTTIPDVTKDPKPQNPQGKKLDEQQDNNSLVAKNPDEFFVKVGLTTAKAPTYCPRCSNQANTPTEIKAYNYSYEAWWGLLGNVFRFLFIGSSATTLLSVVTCERCHRSSKRYQIFEWISRALGIILTFVLIWVNGSEELPLIKRGIGLILLSLSPLVIGAGVALSFRDSTDRMKGIIYLRTDGKVNWFRVQSAMWLREFKRLQEISSEEGMKLENGEQVIDFYKTTLNAWSTGKLESLDKRYKTEAETIQLADFIKKYQPYEGSSLRIFFRNFQPRLGEFLVAIGGGQWYVLTNLRLIQRINKNNDFKEITLAEINTYDSKSKWNSVILVFKLKSGAEIVIEEAQESPPRETIDRLISQSINS